MKSIYLISFLLLTFMFSSYGTQKRIKGSGVMSKENREVSLFHGLDVGSGIHVILKQSDTYSVDVEAEDNIVPLITTKVRDGILCIGIKPNSNIQASRPMKVYVSLQELREIEAGSAAKVNGESVFKTDKLELDISSAAKVELQVETEILEIELTSAAKAVLKGKTQKMQAELSGASKLEAGELQTAKAQMDLNGASSATISVSDELSYDVSSAAKLIYNGHPRIYEAEVSSAGKVRGNQ